MGFERSFSRKGSYAVSTTTLLLGFVVFFNSQIFNGVGSNPIGVKGVQELFYIFLVIFSFSYVLSHSRPTADILVLFLALLLLLLSAVLAAIKFGQPIFLGILENRRSLGILVYFPLVYLLRTGRVSYKRLEKSVVWMALVCAVLSVGIYLGVVPTLQEIDIKEGTSRELRFAIGQAFITSSIVLLLAPSAKATHNHRLLKATLLAFVLLFIIQTRQLISIALIGLFFVGGWGRLLIILGTAFFMVSLGFGYNFHNLDRFFEMFSSALSEQYIYESWRALSIATILSEFGEGNFLGSGGLYIGWNDGFHRIFGPFFYLADVGIFGSLYRYGLLMFLIYGAYVALQIRILTKIQDRDHKRLFTVLFVMLFVASPFAAPLEIRGHIVGFILATSSFFAGIGRKFGEKL